jgi:hypothetical protein
MVALGAALATLPLLASCAATSESRQDAEQRRAAAVLATGSDADSLAAAGLLALLRDRARSPTLLERASAAAPNRPDLVWLQIQVCVKVPACDSASLEARLRSLDPSNGTGWLGSLARADQLKDEEAVHSAMQALSRSDRVDIYWTTLIAHLVSVVVQSRTMPVPDAEALIIGILAAAAIPGYGVPNRYCKGERLQDPATVDLCRGVARALERGDTYLTEMMGTTIAMRVWPEGSPEWAAAERARELYNDHFRLWEGISMRLSETQGAKEFLALNAQYHREQDVWRAQLLAAGDSLDPPGN